MEFIWGLLLIAAAWWVFSALASGFKKGLNEEPRKVDAPELRVTFTTSGPYRSGGYGQNRERRAKTGELTEVAGGFMLNPRAPLPLTLLGKLTRQDAQALKGDLDYPWTSWHVRQELAFMIAQKNLRCPEIDAFVAKQKGAVDQQVEKMRASSAEWPSASEKDRRDLLVGFQEAAIGALAERPPQSRNFRVLLEGPPKDVTADDQLLAVFEKDIEAYKTYMYLISSSTSVRIVAAEDNYRKRFELFAAKGLARRGTDIPMADILASLKLKELNELIRGRVEKPVGRKAKAIEVALQMPDLRDRLGAKISFRELFQVLPPADLDIDELKRSFAWASEVADLFCDTYTAGVDTLERLGERRDMDYSGWRIRASDCCPTCAVLDQKTYKSRPSKLPPYHIGCTCDLEGIFSDETA